jgi:hypothetical protein
MTHLLDLGASVEEDDGKEGKERGKEWRIFKDVDSSIQLTSFFHRQLAWHLYLLDVISNPLTTTNPTRPI